jgi:hypothetical protein
MSKKKAKQKKGKTLTLGPQIGQHKVLRNNDDQMPRIPMIIVKITVKRGFLT